MYEFLKVRMIIIEPNLRSTTALALRVAVSRDNHSEIPSEKEVLA